MYVCVACHLLCLFKYQRLNSSSSNEWTSVQMICSCFFIHTEWKSNGWDEDEEVEQGSLIFFLIMEKTIERTSIVFMPARSLLILKMYLFNKRAYTHIHRSSSSSPVRSLLLMFSQTQQDIKHQMNHQKTNTKKKKKRFNCCSSIYFIWFCSSLFFHCCFFSSENGLKEERDELDEWRIFQSFVDTY